MRPGARIAAAIEVLAEVIERHRPVSLALADWGKAHRFAGSGDRAAIGNLVYDALRRRLSLAYTMGADTPRAIALGAAAGALGLIPEEVRAACDGDRHAPSPLTPEEMAGLGRSLEGAPANVEADVPEWLWPAFVQAFGGRAVSEGQGLARRAPTDLRVNLLKATREKVLKALRDYGAEPATYSPVGIRVPAPGGAGRIPNLQAEAAFQAGWFEVQDEGSQIAALLTGAGPRQQVLDICAGAGGKTLALAAMMQNTGQIHAYDAERERLKAIHDRYRRAGVRNLQVLRAGDREALGRLGDRFDVVLVDAPCTGTGVWRRRPEAKWRLKPESLALRRTEQADILAEARRHVRPGGRLVYVTCSVLPEENIGTVGEFLGRNPEFALVPATEAWQASIGPEPPRSADERSDSLLLTPASHGTDGFFVSVMRRA
jgi:16S rRNA (cytosine967-C5)-methyltransferase